jgi:hypothetical protein
MNVARVKSVRDTAVGLVQFNGVAFTVQSPDSAQLFGDSRPGTSYV